MAHSTTRQATSIGTKPARLTMRDRPTGLVYLNVALGLIVVVDHFVSSYVTHPYALLADMIAGTSCAFIGGVFIGFNLRR